MNKTQIIAVFWITLFLITSALQTVVAYYAWSKCHYLIILIIILKFIRNVIATINKARK
jgi:hypothetical protein